MNKKNIIAIAFVAIVVAAGIVVACTKDKDNQTSKQTQTQLAPKELTPHEALCNDMNYCWTMIESAFETDSTVFLAICDYNNVPAFMAMTGLDNIFYNKVASHISQEIPIAASMLGTDWLSGWSCRPCIMGGLPALGQGVRDLHNTLEELNQIEANAGTPCFNLYVDSCTLRCGYPGLNLYFTEEQRNHCWFVCMILQELEHARNTLNALSMGGDD